MALKLLRADVVATGRPERHRVISLMPGYHGATLQTLALNGDIGAPALWGPLAVVSDKIPAPLTFRAPSAEEAAATSCAALESVIERVGPEQVLAFVMEPIGGQASGVNVPHPSFARRVRAICDRFEIHLVFDEIVSAFRTGRFLAAHHDPSGLTRRRRARQGARGRLRAARRGARVVRPRRGGGSDDGLRRLALVLTRARSRVPPGPPCSTR